VKINWRKVAKSAHSIVTNTAVVAVAINFVAPLLRKMLPDITAGESILVATAAVKSVQQFFARLESTGGEFPAR